MTKSLKKSFYIVATKNGEHFYTEGDFTESEINKYINDFDIDEFIADESVGEEYCGPAEGMYAIYRQATMTMEEGLAIGAYVMNGDTITISGHERTPEIEALYDKRCAEIEAEVEAEFGDNEPLVCLKSYAKVVA